MLTVMCPNCQHQFPVPGCCKLTENANQKETEEQNKQAANVVHPATCYFGALLLHRGYSGGSCFISAPKILDEPAVYQSSMSHDDCSTKLAGFETIDPELSVSCSDGQTSSKQTQPPLLRTQSVPSNNSAPFILTTKNIEHHYAIAPSEQNIATTCKLTNGSVMITTPGIQSGGCVIQSTDAGILVQAPHIEIRPKLSGDGCFIQKEVSTDNKQLMTSNCTENIALIDNAHQTLIVHPNGYSELPGSREKIMPIRTARENSSMPESRQRGIPSAIDENVCCSCIGSVQNLCQCHRRSSNMIFTNNRDSLVLESVGGGMQIQVNATVQLPASLGQCTVNITATTTTPPSQIAATQLTTRTKNNLHGGGIIQPEELNCAVGNRNIANDNEERDGNVTAPLSWLMPCPWSLDTYWINKDLYTLQKVKEALQICGWYHEGISWQQSESLLKDTPIGQWLMRDSSDSRYTFAVSVQTKRGPTSIRVHYFLGRFRLDAEPRLALAMPFFNNPISMLEYYVEYSKRMEEDRTEVWVDYSGQVYSQIYLTKPLIKEVRPLSHLARLAVNRNKLPIKELPQLIKNYLAEYPYTF